jgi:hypothetical protein
VRETARSISNFLDAAHQEWVADPPAPQSARRTLKYQQAWRDFFVSVGFNPGSIRLDYKIPALFDKEYDLVYSPYGIPRLAISFRIIPLHELSAHAHSRIEEAAGDAFNIHSRFPDVVLGYLWVLAIDSAKPPKAGDWNNLRQSVQFLSGLTGRPSVDSPPARYEGLGVYVCSWARGAPSQEHQITCDTVSQQIPPLLKPPSMAGLLLASYTIRFGDLHEPA